MDISIDNKQNTNNKGAGVISGAISLTIATIIVKVLGLIYKIPLASYLGEEGMGYFNSAYTVYGLFYLLCTAGVPKAITMLITEATHGKGRLQERAILKTATRTFLFIGVALTVCFVIFAEPISEVIGNNRAKATMLAVAPSIVFIALGGVLRGYLTAKMNLFSVAVSQILEGVGKLVFGLIFANYTYNLGASPDVISSYTILGVTFGSILGYIYLYISSKISKAKDKRGQRTDFLTAQEIRKRIFSISLPITFSAAVMSIGSIVDLTIIMRKLCEAGYSQIEATSLYGNYTTFAVPMFNLVIALITPISTAFLPIFVRARVSFNSSMKEESYKNALSMSALVSAPMILGMSLFSKEILTLIFGDGGTETGAVLLTVLMPAAFFMSILIMVNTMLEACGDVRTPVISMLVGTLFKIIVSSLLLIHPDFGISGAPIGTVISYAVALIISLSVSNKRNGIHTPIISTHVIPYLNAFISVTVARGAYNRVIKDFSSLVSLAVSILTAGFIYLLMSVISGTVSIRKMKKMAKYTKAA